MRVVKTRWFVRFARREGILDDALIEAVSRAERGLVDADLGGGLIKQRVARAGQGRSGGYRMLVAYRRSGLAVFMFGFAKSTADNVGPAELERFREAALGWLVTDSDQFKLLLEDDKIQEIEFDEEI